MNYHKFGFRGRNFIFYPDQIQLLPDDPPSKPQDDTEQCIKWQDRPDLPASDKVEILINTTQGCNLACPYCFVHRGKFSYRQEPPPDLSPDLARHLIRTLPEAIPSAAEYNIHFYGGEPLLNMPAIDAAVSEALREKESRFSFSITTNGTIDPDTAAPLLVKGNFSVIVSIDGPPEVHDAVRRDQQGQPTHAKVLEFIHRLRKEGVPYIRGSSVIRHGWRLCDAERYLTSLPIDAIKAQAVRLPEGHPLALTRQERELYFTDLENITESVIGSIREGKAPPDDRFNSRVIQLICRSRRESFCGAGTSIFGMGCDGTVYPCVLHAGNTALELGHITDTDHGWVAMGQRWVKSRRQRAECKKCFALPLCGGGCPAMLSVCGKDECEYTRKVSELALAIYGSVPHKPDLLVLAGLI
jgi:uncharacterized protein